MKRQLLPQELRKEAFLNELKRIQYEWSLELAASVGGLEIYDSIGASDEVLLESVRESITALEDTQINE